jgi:hypothetical protein
MVRGLIAMDRKQIEAEYIVERYLADQLTPAEAEAFEAYYTQHPSMVKEIEYALRLKEGLATLRDRQELEALVQAPRQTRWGTTLSIAAVLVATLIGAWTWLGSRTPAPVLAPTLEELVAETKSSLPLGGKYLMVRTRAAQQATLQIPIPEARSALELQMLPSAGAEGAPYTLSLSRVEDGKSTPIAEAAGLTVGPDGLVTTWVDSGALEPGYHTLSLNPAVSGTTMPADRFLIELAR